MDNFGVMKGSKAQLLIWYPAYLTDCTLLPWPTSPDNISSHRLIPHSSIRWSTDHPRHTISHLFIFELIILRIWMFPTPRLSVLWRAWKPLAQHTPEKLILCLIWQPVFAGKTPKYTPNCPRLRGYSLWPGPLLSGTCLRYSSDLNLPSASITSTKQGSGPGREE